MTGLHDTRIIFQSTRPLRGGTEHAIDFRVIMIISIHPPLAGRDIGDSLFAKYYRISIHPPLAGRDDIMIVGFH